MIEGIVEGVAPNFLVQLEIAPETLVIALVLGVLAVALAPLLMARRLWRMDMPSTLRVME